MFRSYDEIPEAEEISVWSDRNPTITNRYHMKLKSRKADIESGSDAQQHLPDTPSTLCLADAFMQNKEQESLQKFKMNGCLPTTQTLDIPMEWMNPTL